MMRRVRGAVAVVALALGGMLIPGTMVGNATAAPATTQGSFDQAIPLGLNTVHVAGWAFDATPAVQSVNVAVYIDSTGYVVSTGAARPDVQAAFGLAGSGYGFQADLPLPSGTHRVCAYALNNRDNPLLGCRTVTHTGDPIGVVDSVELVPAGGTGLFDVVITGWSFDPDSPGTPGGVALYYRGNQYAGSLPLETRVATTDLPRPDVQAAYGLATDKVGFQVRFGYRFCTTFVRLYALNVAGTGTNPLFYNVWDISTDTTRRGTDPGPPPTDSFSCSPN